jgi:hypothetical protein
MSKSQVQVLQENFPCSVKYSHIFPVQTDLRANCYTVLLELSQKAPRPQAPTKDKMYTKRTFEMGLSRKGCVKYSPWGRHGLEVKVEWCLSDEVSPGQPPVVALQAQCLLSPVFVML